MASTLDSRVARTIQLPLRLHLRRRDEDGDRHAVVDTGGQKHRVQTCTLDSLRGSSIEFGAVPRRLAWPLRKDDAHKSNKQQCANLYGKKGVSASRDARDLQRPDGNGREAQSANGGPQSSRPGVLIRKASHAGCPYTFGREAPFTSLCRDTQLKTRKARRSTRKPSPRGAFLSFRSGRIGQTLGREVLIVPIFLRSPFSFLSARP